MPTASEGCKCGHPRARHAMGHAFCKILNCSCNEFQLQIEKEEPQMKPEDASQQSTTMKCYQEGADAFLSNKRKTDNPYTDDSQESRTWLLGWMEMSNRSSEKGLEDPPRNERKKAQERIKSAIPPEDASKLRQITDVTGKMMMLIDEFSIAEAFNITCPARQAALNLILYAGIREGDSEVDTELEAIREATKCLARAYQLEYQRIVKARGTNREQS